MKTHTILLFVFILSAIISGCSSQDNNRIGKEYELNRIWVLESLNGKAAAESGWPNGLPWMELKINSTTLGGNTGCNGMGGTVHATSDKIAFYNIITTQMFCEGVDEIEFLDALKSVDNWNIKNDHLQLMKGGIILASFSIGTIPETETQD